jgi:hypothetical protein
MMNGPGKSDRPAEGDTSHLLRQPTIGPPNSVADIVGLSEIGIYTKLSFDRSEVLTIAWVPCGPPS